MSKQQDIPLLMSKATESLEAANDLRQGEHHGFAASRSYYAMFYAAEALLLHRELQFARHTAVIARFGHLFVKTGLFPPEMFKSLQKGYDLRTDGDYGLVPVTQGDAEAVARDAERFVAEAGEFLRREGYELGPP